MIYLIEPYKKVGDIEFGMTSEEVQNVVNEKPTGFDKLKGYEGLYGTSDKFETFFVFYDKEGKCQAVEFTEPVPIIFNDANLFELNFRELSKMFLELDKDTVIDREGLTSYKFGIGSYAPASPEETCPKLETIIVFRKGYYDKI